MCNEFDWHNAPVICDLNGRRWKLGNEAPESMSWDNAIAWCKSEGGELPSREILLMAYMNSAVVGGFAIDTYWSASEYNSDSAWLQFFSNGNQYFSIKYNTYLVRAVRSEVIK